MIKRKKFNVLLSAFLVSVSLFSLIPYKIDAFIQEPSNTSQNNSETSYLVEDNENYDTMPFKFRKSNELQSIANNSALNLAGLENLNISGSQQFSKMNLSLLLKAINTNLPIIDFDLRQESHGFINGIPISFENKHNNANKGLSNEQVLKKEKAQLDSIKKGVPISFHNHPIKL